MKPSLASPLVWACLLVGAPRSRAAATNEAEANGLTLMTIGFF